jgi:hypothetical protein
MSDKHDPYDHDAEQAAWGTSEYSSAGGGSCVLAARWGNGDIWIKDDKDLSKPHLAFRKDEWEAMLRAADDGDPRFSA